MIMSKVKIAAVGIGGYGASYVDTLLHGLKDTVDFVACVDPYPESSWLLSEIKEANIPVYNNMDEMYANHKVDLTVISTPIFLHTRQILKALEEGSNVLCEKPLSADVRDIDIIKAAKEKAGKFVYIGYQLGFSKEMLEFKNDIADGMYGEVKEMKALVLRPRNKEYFERGGGWAGRITAKDGTLLYDSIANNSAAHYLFNMLFVMGDKAEAMMPKSIKAELLRANNLENFDTSKIDMELSNGAFAHFIAAHPVDKTIDNMFEYTFEKAKVYHTCRCNEYMRSLLPKEYTEEGELVAIFNDGTKKVYGDPFCDQMRKLTEAIKAVENNDISDNSCGVDAAGVQSKVIDMVQNDFKIYPTKKSLTIEENNALYVKGLFEAMMEAYKNPQMSIMDFAEAE